MNPIIPDQAEKLRQLAANETNVSAVMEEPTASEVTQSQTASPLETKPELASDLTPAVDLLEKREPQSTVNPEESLLETANPISEPLRTNELTITPDTNAVSSNDSVVDSTLDSEPFVTGITGKIPKLNLKRKLGGPTVFRPESPSGDHPSPAGRKPQRKIVTPILDSRRFPLNQSTQVIAITGGKGGVGKSNIACNLAIAMAQMNKRVMVLDADLSLANVDVLLGLMPRFNLSHVIRGEKTMKEILIEGPAGVRIVPGGSGVEELSQLNPSEMNRLFEAFNGINPPPDVLLVDTAAGIHPNVMQFLSAADQIIVVTTPEPTAYTDAYALIKTLLKREEGKEIGLLVNMAQNAREAAEVLRLMLQMCRQFLNLSFNNIGYVPRDPDVLKAVRYQKPFLLRSPNSPASCMIRNIAATILQIEMKDKQTGGLKKFINRLFTPASKQAAVS